MVVPAWLRKASWRFALVAIGLLAPASAWSDTPAAGCRIAVLGDSLTAGYGLANGEGFPAQLEQALRADGRDCAVLDAGVSGDTTAGGLARLDWTLADQPSHVIVELGANDGLRALPVAQMKANLSAIVTRLKQADIPVLLAGMLAPPNLGEEYGKEFQAAFQEVADATGVPLYPFFLDGVIGQRDLIQPDGLHPTAAGIGIMVERMLPAVQAWLEQTAAPS